MNKIKVQIVLHPSGGWHGNIEAERDGVLHHLIVPYCGTWELAVAAAVKVIQEEVK